MSETEMDICILQIAARLHASKAVVSGSPCEACMAEAREIYAIATHPLIATAVEGGL